MSKKEKFLSDKILDLINPTPVNFDPEADIHTETSAKVVDNDDFDEDDFSDDGALSVFRKRNVQLIEEVDKRYAGKKVTRKSIGSFSEERKEPASSGDESDERFSEDEDEKSEDEVDKSEDEGDNSVDEENENLEKDLSENDGSEEEIPPEGSDDGSGSDDSEGGEDLSGVEVEDSDGDEADVSKDFVHLATKDAGAEIDKGKAIRTQLSLWDGLLEARISLQKVLVAANKLPQPAEKEMFIAQGGKDFTKAARGTQKAISTLLDKLIDLREQRLKSNSETMFILGTKNGKAKAGTGWDEEIASSEDEENPKTEPEPEPEEIKPKRKRKLDDYAEELTKQHSQFVDYRNATIKRWNDKTRISTGKLGGRDFSGFEQPTLRQIEQIMSNMPRLVARTRVKRTAFRSLGKPAAQVDPDLPPVEETDREIFDDSDFYHVQLRELIERKTGSEPLGRQWLAVQAARSKMKRKCDTSSTKGRRLRYTPHAKLLSFMAPIPEMPCNFDARNELYLSLFGAKRV